MKFSSRIVGVALMGATMMVSGGFIAAQSSSAVDQIKSRQAHYKEMATAYKTINDQVKAGTLDRAAMTEAAKVIATQSRGIPTWFPPGTGAEAGIETFAKPEVWTQRDDFLALAAKLPPEADKLVQVVAAGDADAIGAQLKATGGACGACHKVYRLPLPQ